MALYKFYGDDDDDDYYYYYKRTECWHVGGGELTGTLHVLELQLAPLPSPPSVDTAESRMV